MAQQNKLLYHFKRCLVCSAQFGIIHAQPPCLIYPMQRKLLLGNVNRLDNRERFFEPCNNCITIVVIVTEKQRIGRNTALLSI